MTDELPLTPGALAAQGWRQHGLREEVKANLVVGSPAVRVDRIPGAPDFPPRLSDLLAPLPTASGSIAYPVETAATDPTVEVAPGSAKPEAALTVTSVTDTLSTVAVWIPVTTEVLEDDAMASAYLDRRLERMLRDRLDKQIVAGDNTGANIQGFLATPNIQTVAFATSIADTVAAAVRAIRVNAQSEPDAVALHPDDYQKLLIVKVAAANLYQNGFPLSIDDDGNLRLWNLRVFSNLGLTAGTGLVGAFSTESGIAVTGGMTISRSSSVGTYFTTNIVAVLAEIRAALVVFKPPAFAKLTGLT
jgi:HK97 family phage major capsid protein